jgi:hypothetical protein
MLPSDSRILEVIKNESPEQYRPGLIEWSIAACCGQGTPPKVMASNEPAIKNQRLLSPGTGGDLKLLDLSFPLYLGSFSVVKAVHGASARSCLKLKTLPRCCPACHVCKFCDFLLKIVIL